MISKQHPSQPDIPFTVTANQSHHIQIYFEFFVVENTCNVKI